MNKRIVTASVAGSLCLLATLLFSAELTQTKPPVSGETSQLRKQVKELEARVRVLEGKVRQLEARPGPQFLIPPPGPGNPRPPAFRMIPPPPPGTIVRPPPGAPGQPKIWGEGECNGWRFYLVPVGDGAASAGPAGTPPVPPR